MGSASLRMLPPPPNKLLSKASLFLDLDGTLIETAARPEAVIVDNALLGLLERLVLALDKRVAVVSGRTAAQVSVLLRGTKVAIAGSHGAEIVLEDGTESKPAAVTPPGQVFEQLQRLAASHTGVLIETKPYGVAIHYRLAPSAEQACRGLAERIAASESFALQPGKQVIELKYCNIDKGDAVRTLLDMQPMKAGRPLFIGDDLTDEAGFAAAAEAAGAGILVGPPRMTHASYRLPDVGSALRWLENALASVQ